MKAGMRDVLKLASSTTFPPCPASTLEEVTGRLGTSLPKAHMDVLMTTNGLMVFGGCFRLFSATFTGRLAEIAHWNDTETWKFAWPVPAHEYLCFGETAFGDQYAYRMDDLKHGAESVYFLSAYSQQVDLLSHSFADFVERVLVRNASAPYDTMIVDARRRLGDLDASEHFIQIPSIMIAGYESIDLVFRMDGVSAMIANGDIFTQISAAPSGEVSGLDPYVDNRGRSRLRIRWA